MTNPVTDTSRIESIAEVQRCLCPCCMQEHDVKTVSYSINTLFKGVHVQYVETCFYCDVADETYADRSMLKSNDIAMKNAYRKQLGLLSSDEILAIRNKYGVSQADFSLILGWGEKTITRYESHQVQDKAYDSILRKIDKDPEWFLELLSNVKEQLPEDSYNKYWKKATQYYEEIHDNYKRKAIESSYAAFADNDTLNGCRNICLDKVIAAIRVLANRVDNLFKVKLMKMLWYADFISFRENGHSITGLVYLAYPMGALPVEHDTIISLDGIPCEEMIINNNLSYLFKTDMIDKDSVLDESEINTLEYVIGKLGNMTTEEIVEFMHKEKAYNDTELYDYISYSYSECLQI